MNEISKLKIDRELEVERCRRCKRSFFELRNSNSSLAKKVYKDYLNSLDRQEQLSKEINQLYKMGNFRQPKLFEITPSHL